MTKYATLLDDEVRAFIARTEQSYPENAVELTITEQRQVYDAMCRDFDVGHPEGVRTWDEDHAGVPCRRYEAEPSEVTLVYIHGGGFVVGGLESHDSICADLCAATGLRVVAIDYPLAPEHTYPEDFNAALAAYRAISQGFLTPCVLVGDSAGGNLCAGLSHTLRGDPHAPIGQVLIYAALGSDGRGASFSEHAEAPLLNVRDMAFYREIRTGGPAPVGDPCFAPLQDTDFSNLPPTVAISAECDPIASDGEFYADRIAKAGGKAVWVNEPGLVHGYLRARYMSAKARDSFARICRAASALAQGTWPVPDL